MIKYIIRRMMLKLTFIKNNWVYISKTFLKTSGYTLAVFMVDRRIVIFMVDVYVLSTIRKSFTLDVPYLSNHG